MVTSYSRVLKEAVMANPEHRSREARAGAAEASELRHILIHWLRGMLYREIAEQLAIGDKAVEYHLMRALARFRRVAANLK